MRNFKKVILFYLILFYFIIISIFIKKKLFSYNFGFYKKNSVNKKPFIIEVDVSGIKGGRGPGKFIKGIKDILPYNTNKCSFIASNIIIPINGNNKSDFYFLPFPHLKESIYNEWIRINKVNKLILGPIFVPNYWKLFPNKKVWKEKKFPEIIKLVKGIGVHSNRVRNYLARKSNTIHMIKKFIIIRPCTNLKPTFVKSFNKRKIDILFFEKYMDLNRKKQGEILFKLIHNSSLIVERLKYGNYTKEIMTKLANESKFIIYFSFYDTGAIGLKEIQNYGVIAFSHQKDLIINKDTGFFVPELANENNMKLAFDIIMKKVKIMIQMKPNTYLIAKINQEINKCQNALDDLCKGLL